MVVQASENLTSRTLHNNVIISRDDADLYAGYLAYWRDLAAQTLDLNYYRHVDGTRTIAYFFPRNDGGDTVESVLENVVPTSTCEIRITMAFWNEARKGIATKLVGLHKAGCDVRVLTRDETTGVAGQDAIIHQLRAGHIKVGIYPTAGGSNIHSKYMTIDAQYATSATPKEHRQLVFTGSHNYTGGALTANDETLMRVEDATVFKAFHDNWLTIRSQIPDKAFHD